MAFSSWRTWVTGEVVTAAHMNQEVRDNGLALFPNQVASVDWDPVLQATITDPNGSVDGARYRIGAMEFLWFRWSFAAIATPYGDGDYFITLPNATANISSSAAAGGGQVVGSWQARDSSVPQQTSGEVLLRSGTEVHFNTSGTGLVGSASPWVWASGDILSAFIQIPIA